MHPDRWALERFSQRPTGVGQRVLSPWFTAGGHEWRLRVYPGSSTADAAGHLSGERWRAGEMRQRALRWGSGGSQHTSSAAVPTAFAAAVFLASKAGGMKAKVTLTVVDQGAAEPQHVAKITAVRNAGQAWGFWKFLTHEALHARPGYLAGDRLLLRATVEVVPS